MTAAPLPRFFLEWRAQFGASAAGFTPVDYLNQGRGVPFAIAAQWLFAPEFVEYRGCVLVARDDAAGGLSPATRAIVDDWSVVFSGDVAKVESKANLLHLDGLFPNADLTPYEADLPALARSVARCWDALLHREHPEQAFTVEAFDEDDYPAVTFFSAVR